jgi:hypothetical protein
MGAMIFKIQGVKSVRLWAETHEKARKISEELDIPLGDECETTPYAMFCVYRHGKPLNGLGWGLSCQVKVYGLHFLMMKGIVDVELVKPFRKKHEVSAQRLDRIKKANEFRDLVIQARKDLRWTQEDLAFKVGVKRSVISGYERFARVPHKFDAILNALGLNPEWPVETIKQKKNEKRID